MPGQDGDDGGFEALVGRSPEPVAVYCGGRLVYANPALAVYLGYGSVGEVAGTSVAGFVAAHAGADEDQALLEACFARGGWSRELRLSRRDGAVVVALLRVEPLAFGGRAAHALFIRDVTERARASDALVRSEQDFRTIIERSPLAMCVSRRDRIVYVNRAMLEYLGYDAEATMIGPTLAELSDELIHPADRKRTQEAFAGLFARLDGAGALKHDRLVRLEDVRLRSKRDGSLRYCDMHGVLVMHDGLPALVTTLHDHTDRRAAAERIRIADRMSSLGMLAAGVAHEINNPLTYVIGNLELVASRLPPGGDVGPSRPDLADALGKVQTGLDRIRRTVRTLKAFTRADEETVGPVDLVAVLDSCIEMAETHLRHRGRAVRAYQAAPPVLGNDARLAQVFLNLLVNAAEALDEESHARNEVVVSVAASERTVTVEVRDNGCGIGPEGLQRIFDPFYTTKPVGVGTGLGLFVSRGIVTSLGGSIAIDSTPGKGTSVRIRLPAAILSQDTRPPPDEVVHRERARILVVDDEPLVLDLVRRILQPEHDVETVPCAREALTLVLRGEPYALILCDLMMPDMNGAELYARLAHDAPEAACRLAFMTGGAVSAAGEDALERAQNPRLEKPFQARELLAFVRKQLARFT
jgi:PAS domain S-box-containing protein